MAAELTADAIRSLPAGREMDALLAVRCMGYRWYASRYKFYKDADYQPWTRWLALAKNMTGCDPNVLRESDGTEPLNGEPYFCVPKYSSNVDWRHTWMHVLDWLNERFWVSIEMPGGKRATRDGAEVSLFADFWEQAYAGHIITGETLPEAIGRAALLTTLEAE